MQLNQAVNSVESKDLLIADQSRVIRELRDLVDAQDYENDDYMARVRQMQSRLVENT